MWTNPDAQIAVKILVACGAIGSVLFVALLVTEIFAGPEVKTRLR